ncbi:hypothetical protein VHEMI09648 [[Torrubiella] hemipterigena]|uniref:RecA family profile 1 domain-containing protein n=1 Tax=[Torrubiella] hemipterigena TaxID=1531966 RepID=A0A0A1TQP7_9HYPO|nr:hypothetical protein VHEMI09648 [[Torrubiella] hemipterigena]
MTDLLHIIPSFPAGPFAKILNAVEQHNFSTTDLLALHPADIAKQTRVPLLDLKRFIAAIQVSLSDDVTVDTDFLGDTAGSAEQELPKPSVISTLDDELDAALGGGIPVGCISEFAGESGAAKTQFLLSLSLAVQLPQPRGLGKNALYISTESSLATRRLAQMLANHPLLKDLEGGAKPSLDNILSTITPDLESQDHIIEYQVPVLVERHNVGLIILDSVAANYRAEFEHKGSRGSVMAARSAQLVKLGAVLRDLARIHGLAVVVANQVADRFDSGPSTNMLRHAPPRMNPMVPPESPLASRSNPMPPPSTFSSTPSSSMPFPPSEEEVVPPTLHLDHQQRWFTGWGDEPYSSHSLKTPSLGLVWSTQISCRVALFKRPVYGRPRRVAAPLQAGDDDDADLAPTLKSWRRWMKVIFAPHAGASGQGISDATEFEVTAAGLKAVHRPVKAEQAA